MSDYPIASSWYVDIHSYFLEGKSDFEGDSETKWLVMVVIFCSVWVITNSRPQEQETTTTTFVISKKKRALEDWTTETRSTPYRSQTETGVFRLIPLWWAQVCFTLRLGKTVCSTFHIMRVFWWTLDVNCWLKRLYIYLNYHLLFCRGECAITLQSSPGSIYQRMWRRKKKKKEKKTLRRNHVLLANEKGMYILKRTSCVFLTYYKFIINVCVNIDLE